MIFYKTVSHYISPFAKSWFHRESLRSDSLHCYISLFTKIWFKYDSLCNDSVHHYISDFPRIWFTYNSLRNDSLHCYISLFTNIWFMILYETIRCIGITHISPQFWFNYESQLWVFKKWFSASLSQISPQFDSTMILYKKTIQTSLYLTFHHDFIQLWFFC